MVEKFKRTFQNKWIMVSPAIYMSLAVFSAQAPVFAKTVSPNDPIDTRLENFKKSNEKNRQYSIDHHTVEEVGDFGSERLAPAWGNDVWIDIENDYIRVGGKWYRKDSVGVPLQAPEPPKIKIQQGDIPVLPLLREPEIHEKQIVPLKKKHHSMIDEVTPIKNKTKPSGGSGFSLPDKKNKKQK